MPRSSAARGHTCPQSRSAFTGTGGWRALDDALPAAIKQKTGGLLQSTTYFGGLSGGSWPPSSYALYGYPAFDDLVNYWHVDVNRLNATNVSDISGTSTSYFTDLHRKYAAGFNVSASDYLGRAFSYEFVPGAVGGIGSTWSSIVDMPSFKNFSGPMPLLQSASLVPGLSPFAYNVYYPLPNATIYEWTPFEFGSWDQGFTPTKYVGSKLDASGNANICVTGLDQTGFVMASAAAAWNFWWLENASNGTLGSFIKRSDIAHRLHQPRSSLERRDVFPGAELVALNAAFNETFNLSLSQISDPSLPAAFLPDRNVTLTDNSEANQDLPFFSLIQPARHVDFIMAWDDDSDSEPYSWNNGSSMHATYLLAKAAGLPFPAAPPASTFLARNYTLRPTFFGCNVSLTTTGDTQTPIIMYMTNAPYSWYSNFSWNQPAISGPEFRSVLTNGFDFITQGNGTLDSEWTQCIGCAAVDRSLERMGMQRTEQCERCFAKYCWDGTEDDSWAGDEVFDPALVLDPGYSFTEWVKTHPFTSD